jgi:cysteinyl-tRNA synthetase
MSTKYLGQTFDIHGGGMDLKFPHHECEIAQSVGADGKEPVRYWMHGNMLTFEGSKMSKSLGNTFTPLELVNGDHELLEQGYSPMTVRFFMLQSHYASTLDFSNEALKAAEKGYSRLTNSLNNLNNISYKTGNQNPEKEEQVNKLIDSLFLEMNDDFNTAKAIAVLFELSSIINSFYDEKIQVGEISEDTFNRLKTIFNAFIFDVLGLKVESNSDNSTLDQVMEVLIGLRQSARENKDWALADRIRDELAKANIQIKDEKGKTTYGIIK